MHLLSNKTRQMGMKMAEITYVMCMVMSVACAFLLVRGYRRDRSALLLWSSACFACIALNCAILVLDLVVFPEVDFGGALMRSVAIASAGMLLLFGLVWEQS